ncbi:MAG: DMT family transporter [Hyphomicrobiales bacterium]|nr:DMT family transporter [Hyphomicrobiales bacterium]
MRLTLPPQTAATQDNLRGILAMLAAMALFILNDAMIKLAGTNLPVGQVVFLRGLMASGLVLAWAGLSGALANWRRLAQQAVLWRTVGEIGSTLLYLSALMAMPIGNATAILQVVPLAATAASALFLAEAVGWRRWSAAAFGFFGTMLIIRPGMEGFNWASLLALSAIAFIVLRDLSTRWIARDLPSMAVTAVSAVAVAVAGAGLGLSEDWIAVSSRELALLAGAAVCLVGGYLTGIMAMRSGEVSAVAPFRYSIILWALILGYLVWGDVPRPATLVGIAIVVAAGIYTFEREARFRRRARAAARNQ